MTDPNGRARFSEKSTTRYETQIKYCAEPVKFHKQPFSLQKKEVKTTYACMHDENVLTFPILGEL